MKYSNQLKVCYDAGLAASKKVMEIYESTKFDIITKEDDSPVTTADLASNEIIVSALRTAYPDYAILSEETLDDPARLKNDYVFIIDPIDGTKDFIAHNNEFAINIALVHKCKAVLGLVFVPALNIVYIGIKKYGSYKRSLVSDEIKTLHVSNKKSDLTVLISRFHCNDAETSVIEKHNDRIKHIKTVGSAYKICCIAEGIAELTYRFNPGTKEWDTAAPQVVLEAAGGRFIDFTTNKPMLYNRDDVRNLKGYIAVNSKKNILL